MSIIDTILKAFVGDKAKKDVKALLPTILQDGDVLLTQGAGDIAQLAVALRDQAEGV